MNFDSVLWNRRSIREYSDSKISLSQVTEIANAARFAPMAGNIYTIKLIIISDEKKKQQIVEAASRQFFIADALYAIVVCSDKTQLERSYGERAKIYARQQAGAAIENMLLKVTDFGLASCWVGAFDEEKIKSILKIPQNIDVEAILPIGKPAKKLKAKMKTKVRKKPDLKMIAYFNAWGKKEKKEEKKVEAR